MTRRQRDLTRLVRPLGWEIVGQTNGGHLRLRHKSGAIYTVGLTPSDRRAEKNMLAQMRRISAGATSAAQIMARR